MRINFTNSLVSMVLLSSLAVLAMGCGQQGGSDAEESSQASDTVQQGHDHSGWWCAEHGIPEEQCSMCSKKAADDFKANGDWCEEHNRAESQCFQCDPTRAEKFTKLYEAKYGKQPPQAIE